jgi:hypothetical protein
MQKECQVKKSQPVFNFSGIEYGHEFITTPRHQADTNPCNDTTIAASHQASADVKPGTE